MVQWVGLPSVIVTFPSYTVFLCIDADTFWFPLQSTSQAVNLKVDQTVFILMLFR